MGGYSPGLSQTSSVKRKPIPSNFREAVLDPQTQSAERLATHGVRNSIGLLFERIRGFDAALDSRASQQSSADTPTPRPAPLHAEGILSPPLDESLPTDISLNVGSFLRSKYAAGILVMAIVLNRVQHIVVPSRRNPRLTADERRRLPFWRYLGALIFPVDLSSTLSRTILRIPTLFFLSKALGLWIIVLLQSLDWYPNLSWSWIRRLGDHTSSLPMDKLCWSSFLAVCGALCVGALTSGLEGTRNSNAQPFNLFGFAFNMHLVSHGFPHMDPYSKQHARPDSPAVFVLMVPILQLALIHAIGVKRSWSTQRLIPTAICSLLLMAHFHAIIWTEPSRYPFIFSSYVMTGLESVLVFATVIALVLNALTQLLLEGSVTRPLFGHSEFLMPRWDEDFHTALLRLGTASFEATSVAGLGNEVGNVALAQPKPFGELKMNRAGVLSLTHAVDVSDGGRRVHTREGFANEIRRIKVEQADELSIFWKLLGWRDTARFGRAIFGALKNFFVIMWRRISLHISPSDPNTIPGILDRAVDDTTTVDVNGERQADLDRDVYRRFLSGETISDDEEEFDPDVDSAAWEEDYGSSDASASDSASDEEAELLTANAISSATAPLLLAHMSNPGTKMTRRRYGRLSVDETQPADDAWDEFVEERRAVVGARSHKPRDDERRFCVICTVEERRIICWPCRCLALCDDCRENVASRSAPSKHFCPCCRQSVEGFSRIFIP
ncbi:hypothetical protein K488DRAFT_46407 [Vararia minispora EC-137]|uniref:Uncharacterized protein n=1 Tax=Vararia minispora EC-137 TaxID=1314806 RepID=A0ACB8QR69_9AGAM|nr:hypothetical protein K488DRAFT_46407 [Vararia minispora EC-137]